LEHGGDQAHEGDRSEVVGSKGGSRIEGGAGASAGTGAAGASAGTTGAGARDGARARARARASLGARAGPGAGATRGAGAAGGSTGAGGGGRTRAGLGGGGFGGLGGRGALGGGGQGGGSGGGSLGRGSCGGSLGGGSGRLSGGGGGGAGAHAGAVDLDAVGAAGVAVVRVGLGGVVVLDSHALDEHGERSLRVVGLATSPVNGTLAVARVTTSPDTNADIHGGLGEAGAALSIGIVESADIVAVDRPDDVVLGPLHGVGVENIVRGSDSGPSVTVIGGSVTLSKVVGLNLGVVSTKSFL